MSPLDVIDSGQAVETMIAEGRRIMDAAIEEYKPIAIVAAFSGGDDSIVSCHFATENYNAVVLHCDTLTGVRPTRTHVTAVAARFGWDLRIIGATPEGPPEKTKNNEPFDPAILPCGRWTDGESAYAEYVLNFGFPGVAMHGRMFQRLKGRPIAAIQRDLKAGGKRSDTVLLVSGIRKDESARRAGYNRDTQKEPKSSRVWVNPFYWHSASHFESYRQEFGLPRNPVKATIGVSGECNCGSFAGNAELDAIRRVDAARHESICSLGERMTSANGYPWGWGEDPPSWWMDAMRGQQFLFPPDDDFRPMCVGCKLRRAAR